MSSVSMQRNALPASLRRTSGTRKSIEQAATLPGSQAPTPGTQRAPTCEPGGARHVARSAQQEPADRG